MSKPKHRPKYSGQKKHAKKRAYQRYGILLNNDQLRQVIKDIQEGRAKFIRRSSRRVTIFEVELDGQICKVVYDSKRGNIATFLPPQNQEKDDMPQV